MLATVRAALEEAEAAAGQPADRIAAAISFGALMGARGNSGVITSQIFRGHGRGARRQEPVQRPRPRPRPVEGREDGLRRGRQAGRGHDPDGHPRIGGRRRHRRRARQRHRDGPGRDPRCRREVGRADAEPARDPARGRRRRFGRAGPLPAVPGRAAAPRRPGAGWRRPRSRQRRRRGQAVDARRPRRRGLRLRDDVPAPAERVRRASTSTRSATTSRSIGESVLVAGDARALKIHVHNERPDLVVGVRARPRDAEPDQRREPGQPGPRRPRDARGRVHREPAARPSGRRRHRVEPRPSPTEPRAGSRRRRGRRRRRARGDLPGVRGRRGGPGRPVRQPEHGRAARGDPSASTPARSSSCPTTRTSSSPRARSRRWPIGRSSSSRRGTPPRASPRSSRSTRARRRGQRRPDDRGRPGRSRRSS